MQRLKSYRVIAWDFDGTLVDHDKSFAFAEFVKENPHGHDFYIVTFRSHGLEDDIDADMSVYGLDRTMFKGVINLPDAMYEAYHHARTRGDHEAITAFHTWKGKVCKEVGAGLLIDDMSEQVCEGCALYDVDYLHPDSLSVEVSQIH